MKNRIWRPLAALVVMATVWFCATAQEYAGTVYRYVLFNGTALDSTGARHAVVSSAGCTPHHDPHLEHPRGRDRRRSR